MLETDKQVSTFVLDTLPLPLSFRLRDTSSFVELTHCIQYMTEESSHIPLLWLVTFLAFAIDVAG